MVRVICVMAHGDARPGDVAEVPDGAEVSALYWAPEGSAEAAAAIARAPELEPVPPAPEAAPELAAPPAAAAADSQEEGA